MSLGRTLIGIAVLLLAAEASTEEYTIVAGSLTDATTGESESLTGGLEIRIPAEPTDDASTVHIIDDFEIQAGNQSFLPSLPIEYDERVAATFVQIANQIHVGPQGVEFFHIRSGGDPIEVNDDEVTFRFFDFGPGPPSPRPLGARAVDVSAPRHFRLRGVLRQVDQRFRIRDDSCPEVEIEPLPPGGGVIITAPPPRPLPPGGGVIITVPPIRPLPPGGGVIITAPPPRPLPPGGGVIITRPLSSDAGSRIRADGRGKRLRSSEPFEVPEAALSFSNLMLSLAAVFSPPSLEELSIRAPAGADVSIDGDRVLRVHSTGDIYLEGPIPEISGVIRIHIVADGGTIVARPSFEVPPGLSVDLDASGGIELPGEPVPPGPDVGELDPPGDPPLTCGFFSGLVPLFPADETDLGNFSMIASMADQAVEIDVMPWHERNRLRARSHKPIWVTLFGSEELDVRDVDRSSLRLGRAEGEPISRFGYPLVFRWDMNRDGHRDLLAVFKQGELGVVHGDTDLCLRAESHSGATFEGCDEIETRRGHTRRRSRRRDRERSDRESHRNH
ncbi:MAG: hypothetical protein VX466_02605 [Myxococcota bacterium]|nr:hypothetical protein [Myxococcota bacterium]